MAIKLERTRFRRSPTTLAQRLPTDVANLLRAAHAARGHGTHRAVRRHDAAAVSCQSSPSSRCRLDAHRPSRCRRSLGATSSHDSNERLVRETCCAARPRVAQFVPLYVDAPTPEQGCAECRHASRNCHFPFDAVAARHGRDGHTASLFPGGDHWSRRLRPGGRDACHADACAERRRAAHHADPGRADSPRGHVPAYRRRGKDALLAGDPLGDPAFAPRADPQACLNIHR